MVATRDSKPKNLRKNTIYTWGEPKIKFGGFINRIGRIISDFNLSNPAIINGTTIKGEFVTLYKCFLINGEQNYGEAGSFLTTEFIADYAFFGHLFYTTDEINLQSISIRFLYLDDWHDKKCIQTTHGNIDTTTISFIRPSPIIFQVNDFQIALGISETFNNQLISASISAIPKINITVKSEKQFDCFNDFIKILQSFFSFSFSEPTFIIEMSGRLLKADKSDAIKMKIQKPIRIYFKAPGWHSERHNYLIMLLPYSKIETDFSLLVEKWIKIFENIQPVIDLYFSGIYRSVYSQNEFLELTQAIETYHSRIYGGEYIAEDIFLKGLYLQLLEAIPENIEKDFRNSLKMGKLRYANEYSLRKRILLLTDHISSNLQINFLVDSNMRHKFSDLVADTRNYFVHNSPELKIRAATDSDKLFELIQELHLLVIICLFEQMKFPFDRIYNLLKNHERYYRFFDNLSNLETN